MAPKPVEDARLDVLLRRMSDDKELDRDSRDALADKIDRAYHTSSEEDRRVLIADIRWMFGEAARMRAVVGEHFNGCPVNRQVKKALDGRPIMPWPSTDKIKVIVEEQVAAHHGPTLTFGKFKATGSAAIVAAVIVGVGALVMGVTYYQHHLTRMSLESHGANLPAILGGTKE